jgi:hypothetical protein
LATARARTIVVVRLRRTHRSPGVNVVDDQEDAMGFVRRRARRRTALVVGGAAYAYGKHRGRQAEAYDDQGSYDQGGYDQGGYDQPPPPPPPQAAPAAPIDYDQLAQLGKLHESGTLTDEEFAAAKAKILGG